MEAMVVMEMQPGGRRPELSSGIYLKAKAGAADKAVMEKQAGGRLWPAPTGAADKAVGGNKKRTKKFVVRQEYINELLKGYPFKPFPWDPEVLEKRMPDRESREEFLAMIPSVIATMKAERDKAEDIIRQYFAKGYAVEEVEVDDDEA